MRDLLKKLQETSSYGFGSWKLNEAPIGDLQTYGDFSPDPDWNKERHTDSSTIDNPSRQLLKNPDHLKRIRNAFEKTPFMFNLYFVVVKKKNMIMNWDDFKADISSRTSSDGIRPRPDHRIEAPTD